MDGLIAEHISKTYAGAHGLSFAALRDVSLHLEPGSFTSLVGESGSGKSTLLHMIGGLDQLDSGSVTGDGTKITELGKKALTEYRSRDAP